MDDPTPDALDPDTQEAYARMEQQDASAEAIAQPRPTPHCECLSSYADLCQHAREGKSIFAPYEGGVCACACHQMTVCEGMEPPQVRLFLPGKR